MKKSDVWTQRIVWTFLILCFLYLSYDGFNRPSAMKCGYGYILATAYAMLWLLVKGKLVKWRGHAMDLAEQLHKLTGSLTNCQVYVCHKIDLDNPDNKENSETPENPSDTKESKDQVKEPKEELTKQDLDRMHAAKDMVACAHEAISMLASGSDEINVCQGCVNVKITVVHDQEEK